MAILQLAEKSDHNSFILSCPQCEIPFLTKNCNLGRTDILCSFGCKQNHQKAQSRKRSKQYSQKKSSKEKKKKNNKKRSLFGNSPSEKKTTEKPDHFIVYIKLILQILLKTKFHYQEIIELLKKVSSRGLSIYQKMVHYIDYG